MLYTINKFSQKLFFFCMELFFAFIVTILFYPLATFYLNISSTDYFILSMFLVLLGGVLFDRAFIFFYFDLGKDVEKIEIMHYMAMFVAKLLAYLVLGIAIFWVKDNLFLSLYIPFLLFIGGFIWFIILTGFINEKKRKEENSEVRFITRIVRRKNLGSEQ